LTTVVEDSIDWLKDHATSILDANHTLVTYTNENTMHGKSLAYIMHPTLPIAVIAPHVLPKDD
jgi:hypothetical protein